jgi:hypothetical protein
MTSEAAGRGVLVVRRDKGFEGSGCDHRILVDGKPVADLRPGEIVTIYPPPGEHVVALANQGAICRTMLGPAVAFQSEAGERRTFRTGAGPLAPAPVPVADLAQDRQLLLLREATR